LRPQDYLTPELNTANVKGDPSRMAGLETAFSTAALRYANHLYNGRIVPQSVSPLFDIAPKSFDSAALLIELATSDDPASVLAALNPTHPQFLALKASLAHFDDKATDRPRTIAAGSTLRPGMTDARVPALRDRLGLPAVDGLVYDEALVVAMKSFQTSENLEVDGVMGPATLAALNGGA